MLASRRIFTAASPDGPRYDPTLTAEQRSSPDNGIWLCQNCGKLVDNDPVGYTAEVLRGWKKLAEARALRALAGYSSTTDAADAVCQAVQPIPESANRLGRELRSQRERKRRLSREGAALAAADLRRLSDLVEAISAQSKDLGMQFGRNDTGCCIIAEGLRVDVHWDNPFAGSSEDGRLYLRLMVGEPYTGWNKAPTERMRRSFKYGLSDEEQGCWIEYPERRGTFTSEQLAAEAVSMLLMGIAGRAVRHTESARLTL